MSDHDPKKTIHALVRADYDAMTPTERRLADLILNFPGELAGYSASELAEMAGTSKSAVSRLVRRLGFQSYDDLRRRARAEREAGAPLYLLDQSFGDADCHAVAPTGVNAGPADPGAGLIERHVETAIDNLRASFSATEIKQIKELASALAEARYVWIVGFRHGHFLAGYLRWSLAHVRPNVRLLPQTGETLGENLVDVGSDDIMFMFAFRRRVPLIGSMIAAARAAGARVVVATDPGMVTDGGAEWVIRLQSRTRGPIDDHASAIVLAHVITEQVIARLGHAARRRFGRIDDLHCDLAELAS
jgi:DNA-binding MurR/RpiR family transcriptional regulator